MYKNQFILSRKEFSIPEGKVIKIHDLHLFTGPGLELTHASKGAIDIHLLGDIYDWENPECTNQEILKSIVDHAGSSERDTMGNDTGNQGKKSSVKAEDIGSNSKKGKNSKSDTLASIIEASDRYFGEFVCIVHVGQNCYIFGDPCGQREIFYDSAFTTFATQPRLVELIEEAFPHDDPDALSYYNSEVFSRKKLFVGDTTHRKNIKHLQPNHLADLDAKEAKRFFPLAAIPVRNSKEVATEAAARIRGFMKAISLRHSLRIAVTGGYDSRILFLTSLDFSCDYFVSKNAGMHDQHHDITIPGALTSYYEKSFTVEDHAVHLQEKEAYENSIDFPRHQNTKKQIPNVVYMSGKLSEIARNYFGYHKNATAKDLCFLAGYSKETYPIKLYEKWLKNKAEFENLGLNYLDMFYWEEKMGNWAAKTSTESYALGVSVSSPFNSRQLLSLLLGTKRKDRDSHINKLYDAIIQELAQHDKFIKDLEINPSRKQRIIRLMKKLKLYNLYSYIGVKLQILKL